MPVYELTLVLKPMPKREIVDTLKRAANQIWNNNGVIQKIDYLGLNKLPYAQSTKNDNYRHFDGEYFMYKLSINRQKMVKIRPEFKLDMDIILAKFNEPDKIVLPKDYECTLDEELLPPAYRKSVQPLLENKNVYADVRR